MLQPSTLRLPSSSPGDFRRPGGASLRSACPHDTSLCERSRYLFSLACVVYPASQHIFNSVCSPLSCVHCGLFFFFFPVRLYFPIMLLSWAIYLLKFRFILLFCCILLFCSVSSKLFCICFHLLFYGIVGFYWGKQFWGFTFNGWLLGGC